MSNQKIEIPISLPKEAVEEILAIIQKYTSPAVALNQVWQCEGNEYLVVGWSDAFFLKSLKTCGVWTSPVRGLNDDIFGTQGRQYFTYVGMFKDLYKRV